MQSLVKNLTFPFSNPIQSAPSLCSKNEIKISSFFFFFFFFSFCRSSSAFCWPPQLSLTHITKNTQLFQLYTTRQGLHFYSDLISITVSFLYLFRYSIINTFFLSHYSFTHLIGCWLQPSYTNAHRSEGSSHSSSNCHSNSSSSSHHSSS